MNKGINLEKVKEIITKWNFTGFDKYLN
jgi:hypothetical protein